MIDFLSTALPWVLIGIAVAIMTVSISVKKRKLNTKKQGNLEEVNTKNPENTSGDTVDEENYMTMGLLVGMCFGTVLGAIGIVPLSYGISFGMLIGIIVGVCIKKK